MSLSKACEALLGQPLDKANRFSHWGRRPLRPSQVQSHLLSQIASPKCHLQVVYAALDAWSLHRLYRAAQERAEVFPPNNLALNEAPTK